MALTPALRFEVLRALELARERVAHGYPSLQAALHPMRLTPKAWAEVDRAVDDVRFDLGAAPSTEPPLRRPGESAEARKLREALAAAEANSHLPWEDPGGLNRVQLVAVLTCAFARVKALPVVSPGPLFHHLPIRSDT
jgi:hypothetical protein